MNDLPCVTKSYHDVEGKPCVEVTIDGKLQLRLSASGAFRLAVNLLEASAAAELGVEASHHADDGLAHCYARALSIGGAALQKVGVIAKPGDQ